jgi:hypothetical protein
VGDTTVTVTEPDEIPESKSEVIEEVTPDSTIEAVASTAENSANAENAASQAESAASTSEVAASVSTDAAQTSQAALDGIYALATQLQEAISSLPAEIAAAISVSRETVQEAEPDPPFSDAPEIEPATPPTKEHWYTRKIGRKS